ncbi:uncharacterized protein [Dysidea avara]|uniref:uncharacterized protein n=1 Tax=Dysidea avara TaxID=196820 RepID=UPI003325A138
MGSYYSTLLDSASDAKTKARLLSVSSSESGTWLGALPVPSLGTKLDNEPLRIALGLCLGVPIIVKHTHSGGRIPRHAAVNETIRRALVSGVVPAVLEPVSVCRNDVGYYILATRIPMATSIPAAIAASVTNEAKQRAILLSACDARTYRLIRSLSAPNDPKDTSLSDLIKLMSEHYQPKPSVTVQRFKFHSHFHKCGESVATCVAEPKKNSEHCDYGDKLIEMIRDQLVCGINDSHIQRRLLAEPDLTYKKAFDLAQATIDLQGSKQHRNPIDLHYTAVKKSATVVEEVTRLQNVNTKMLFASPAPSVKPTNATLKTYTDEKIKPVGVISVSVEVNKQKQQLTLLIVPGDGPMFKPELGLITGTASKIHIDPSTPPKFFKARPVPYALPDHVDKAIDQLEQAGVIQPVKHSDWASPVVPVVKQDGSIRLCGKTKTEHLNNLAEVLTCLEKVGLCLKQEKCSFMLPSVDYLGHTMSAKSVQKTQEKARAITDAPTPGNVSQFHSFLGLVNYYSKFLPQLATTLAPLYFLLQKKSK